MTPERNERLLSVLNRRQNDLTVLLENVFDPHNISAVMRTCDAVGIQEVYVLNTKLPRHKKWGPKSSSSAHKWLTIRQYADAPACFAEIRKNYSRVLTTFVDPGATPVYREDFAATSVAIVFGNEHSGVSEEIRAMADGDIVIPQMGMIQSLNISVACAVVLYEAYRQKQNAGHYLHRKLSERAFAELWDLWSSGEPLIETAPE